jgi:hypothetical protein
VNGYERKAGMRDAFLQDYRQTRQVPEADLKWRFAARIMRKT